MIHKNKKKTKTDFNNFKIYSSQCRLLYKRFYFYDNFIQKKKLQFLFQSYLQLINKKSFFYLNNKISIITATKRL